MRLGILNMPPQIVFIQDLRNQTRCKEYFQSRWKDQFCKQNKLAKSANFVSKFKAKHAIEE